MCNGRFKIVNINGEVIGLEGRNARNGAMLILQNDTGGLDQQWVLINARTNEAFIPAPPRQQDDGKKKKSLRDLLK